MGRKVVTNDMSVDKAEQVLSIQFPMLLREWIKSKNGFHRGGFRFYGVRDEEDVANTFDDIVRENTNEPAGWKKYLPEGYVAFADDGGQGCLALSTAKDGKFYYWNNEMGKLSVFAETEKEFKNTIEELENQFS